MRRFGDGSSRCTSSPFRYAETRCVDERMDECISAYYYAFDRGAMIDLREQVEMTRLKVRLSQAQLALRLEVTQGHYSKVISGKVPLTDHLRLKMQTWLDTQPSSAAGPQATRRMLELVASIQRECMELMHLANLAGGSGENGSETP